MSAINTTSILDAESTEIKNQIKDLYFKDERVLSLGFSGGKDSSLCLALTLEALLEIPKEDLNKTLYVLYSDTLMELLPVQAHTYKVLDNIKAFSKEYDLPIEVMHSKPSLENTKWSMKFAKGIRPESQDNRWCTTRLKTDVQERMLNETFGTKDIETISIVGSRKEESIDRAKRLERMTIDGHLKGHSVYSKSLVFAPIEDYSTADVWTALRYSKFGETVLGCEELYVLYASTNGEGEECQTILGNAGDNGSKPNCSNSQSRFGCWECGLQHGRDKALVGMQVEYPYIKHLIAFRDWSISTRDGQWDTRRDTYNHRFFTRLQYNEDNKRFGQNAPGGMSIDSRAEGLEKLLETEAKVNQSVDFQLISDDELNFIQHRWVLEGELSFRAIAIAEKYGRKVTVSNDDLQLITYAKALLHTKWIWTAKVSYWYNIYADERFCVQFVKQIIEKYSMQKVKDLINKIHKNLDEHIVPEYLKELQLKDQFYPSPSLEKMIRREWKDDQVSIVTESLVRDHEDTWDESNVVDSYDILENENVSMEDKYAMLDNWNDYVGEDSEEKYAHQEYMRYGGNFQYIKFSERKSQENKIKKLEQKQRRAKTRTSKVKFDTSKQAVFDFAS